ncbi:MAG: 50S ribosomal protein L11 methyltransferase, partial [Casimicrobiaceae bacterium]
GEPGAATDVRWAECRVAALFDPTHTPEALDALWCRARACWPGSIGAPELRVVVETDWVRATQAQFEPIRVDDRLWITPTWCTPPDPDALNLRIDPGLAFGTGSHATTALCLRWLSSLDLRGRGVLDYGTGSGVLALAACALGAARVHGVDIDPLAVDAAKANAVLNALAGETLTFASAEEAIEGGWDIVVANILAGPLTVLAPLLGVLAKPGGYLALSGILEAQVGRIREAYAPWVALDVASRSDGWVLMAGRRAA